MVHWSFERGGDEEHGSPFPFLDATRSLGLCRRLLEVLEGRA